MEQTAIIATVAIALTIFGSIVVLALILNQKSETTTGMTYEYDEQNRLQSVQPINNNYVKLIPMGDNFE